MVEHPGSSFRRSSSVTAREKRGTRKREESTGKAHERSQSTSRKEGQRFQGLLRSSYPILSRSLVPNVVPRSPIFRVSRFLSCMPGTTRSGIESRTRKLVPPEIECLQVRQVPDRLGNGACTSRERGTCEKSPIRFRRVAWALRDLESIHAPERPQRSMFSSLRFVSEPHSVGMPPVNLPAEDMSSFSSDGGISFGSGPARAIASQSSQC